ncbi:MAG TPA: UDP-N-acetylmuramoyl-L-alanyl-D-glutamate--2,6-diaminopimelate ligase [Hyphomicrobiaceae bacterium]|nr:UDP-N-acetylmuramoyl-L-alanyl-D-glutamate--2,6-diaminopimelate ligase [Hyphomicrobiaceae bacterium]
MLLSSLMTSELTAPSGAEEVDITALTADSRKVTPGALFAALTGIKADGAHFILDAVANGAAAVLAAENAVVPTVAVPVLRSKDPHRALALMAARLNSAQPVVTVAVTGTSGKTSVAEFTRQLYAALGRPAASLGTIGLVKPDGCLYGSLTTPEPVTLHATLAELAREGVTHLAFEASSHGLAQRRLDGVRLIAAAFTNLGRDHLDYHPTIEDYFAAKLRLFETLLEPGRPAVVNADGSRAHQVISAARRRGLEVHTVGTNGNELKLTSLQPVGFGQRLAILRAGRSYDVRLPLLGAYQAANALVAAGLAISTGEDPSATLAALETLRGVTGRLDVAGKAKGGLVVVDYAHKPEALEAALDALRPFAPRRLICVFGCGGNRDRGKRPIMGRIAVEKADIVIITDDNPRSEDPSMIRAEILQAAPSALEIGDRATAIATAVDMMGKGDVVLVAGKGHETGQIIGQTVVPFSDHDAVRTALRRAQT